MQLFLNNFFCCCIDKCWIFYSCFVGVKKNKYTHKAVSIIVHSSVWNRYTLKCFCSTKHCKAIRTLFSVTTVEVQIPPLPLCRQTAQTAGQSGSCFASSASRRRKITYFHSSLAWLDRITAHAKASSLHRFPLHCNFSLWLKTLGKSLSLCSYGSVIQDFGGETNQTEHFCFISYLLIHNSKGISEYLSRFFCRKTCHIGSVQVKSAPMFHSYVIKDRVFCCRKLYLCVDVTTDCEWSYSFLKGKKQGF